VRAFCRRCGTPLFNERRRSPHMVNIPRGLFLVSVRRLYESFESVSGMGLIRLDGA
jgi:hypothetical protein